MFLALSIGLTPVWADVYIQNDQKYLGNEGTLHIVGEIQNELSAPLNQVSIDVTLYSKSNEIIDVIKTDSFVNYIMPGMKSPFEIVLPTEESLLVDRYSTNVNYKIGIPKNQVIEISKSDVSFDVLGNLIVKGTVTNNGDTTANIVSIVATFYDKSGNVAFVSKTLTKPDYLKANDNSFFVLSVPRESLTHDYVDYAIVAESDEFAAAPEFPIGTTILLASSVSSYLAISRFSGKFKVNFVDATDSK